MSDDAADVQRVLAGDVDAYAALVDRYYDRCARFAVRMLGNRDDAEDALQATFLARTGRSIGIRSGIDSARGCTGFWSISVEALRRGGRTASGCSFVKKHCC